MNALNVKHFVSPSLQAALLLFVVSCAGCGGDSEQAGLPPVDPQLLAQYRSQLLLTEEPEGAVVLLDARKMLEQPADAAADPASAAGQPSQPADGEQTVAVVGLIGGMPNPWIDTEAAFPWKAGAPAFYLADPPTAMEFSTGGHVHDDPNDCIFCSARARDRLDAFALVNLVDAAGNPVPIDARQLLDVQTPATVVVRGKATLIGPLMAIEADAIYVRP